MDTILMKKKIRESKNPKVVNAKKGRIMFHPNVSRVILENRDLLLSKKEKGC